MYGYQIFCHATIFKFNLFIDFLQRHRRSPHIWYHLLPAVTSALLIGRIISSPTIFVSAQCFGGVETYEKTSGTTVVCAENECTSRGLLTQPDTSVTRDCIAICKQSSNCNSFTVGKKNMLIFGCTTMRQNNKQKQLK